MKISGFTLVRHGVKFDYPFEESLKSLAPLVDELVVNVGVGIDSTLDRVKALAASDPLLKAKVKIFESTWPLDDPEKKRGGQILAEQTNLALDRCTGDWCVYLQADEVLHEQDVVQLRARLSEVNPSPEIEGLVFEYVHFYGSYDVIQSSRSAYRREVRAFRRASRARSVGDAQSFRKLDGTKLKVVPARARVFHYGWVRPPEAMREKTEFMDQLYHGPNGAGATGDNYRYKRIFGLREFQGTHPSVMLDRIQKKNWHWEFRSAPLEWRLRDGKRVALDWFERLTGKRLFEYRSYELL